MSESKQVKAPEGLLLDVKGVAAMLNVSTRTVQRLTDAGKLPAPVKLGALRRWPKGEVVEWISDGCRPARPVRKGGAA